MFACAARSPARACCLNSWASCKSSLSLPSASWALSKAFLLRLPATALRSKSAPAPTAPPIVKSSNRLPPPISKASLYTPCSTASCNRLAETSCIPSIAPVRRAELSLSLIPEGNLSPASIPLSLFSRATGVTISLKPTPPPSSTAKSSSSCDTSSPESRAACIL